MRFTPNSKSYPYSWQILCTTSESKLPDTRRDCFGLQVSCRLFKGISEVYLRWWRSDAQVQWKICLPKRFVQSQDIMSYCRQWAVQVFVIFVMLYWLHCVYCLFLVSLFRIQLHFYSKEEVGMEFLPVRVSGKLPSYPSPNLTSTLTSRFGQNLDLGRGRWTVSQKRQLIRLFQVWT